MPLGAGRGSPKPLRSPPKKYNGGTVDARNIIDTFNASHDVTALLGGSRI